MPNTNQTPFEIGDKVFWVVGKFIALGLFQQKNEDGTSSVKVYQRNNQKCCAGSVNVPDEFLKPQALLPKEQLSIL